MTKETILTFEEAELCGLQKDRATVIIATSTAPLRTFMLSIFALLMRARSDVIEHLIVSINGPDPRTGDTGLQDRKQKFLEDLRLLKWRGRDMPLTVQRIWSRVGHAHSLDSAIPWVHTEFYFLMHDDVILLDGWEETVAAKFVADPNCLMAVTAPLLHGSNGLKAEQYPVGVFRDGQWGLHFPHLNSSFVACRKAPLSKMRWYGHHVTTQVDLKDHPEFFESLGTMPWEIQKERIYSVYGIDIGGWMFYELKEKGFEFTILPQDIIHHFGAMSYGLNKNILESKLKRSAEVIRSMESLIAGEPEYDALYKRYCDC